MVKQVRRPDFDFSQVVPHWAPNAEAAQLVNASHMVPAYIEPFLIKVMRRAKADLDPERDAQLLADIDVFNQQEGQHAKMHAAALRMVRDHYPGIAEHERAFRSAYQGFLERKSLRFLLAYSDGFEAYASATAQVWVDGRLDRLFQGGDEQSLAVWKWHLAEEYEHRSVVFQVYERLYGRPAWRGWLYRVAMYGYSQVHIGWSTGRLYRHLLGEDRTDMSVGQRKASKRRTRQVAVHTQGRFLTPMIRPLSPSYDPANLPPPARLDDVLACY
ncbi:MAG: metal-dependent hydrolase [Acidimicrobiales bacterium]